MCQSEYERSYIFTHDSFREFASGFEMGDPVLIKDFYIDPSLRVRREPNKNTLTRKTGEKIGCRNESISEISDAAADLLCGSSKLCIKKSRRTIYTSSRLYNTTVDFIESPMKLAVLEVERTLPGWGDSSHQIVPVEIIHQIFSSNLKECSISTWNFFKRKIAFCGPPSSGKTEMAKWLSHTLNTQFNANTFAVTEYATSFIQKYGRNPEFDDQFFIWYGQWKREQNASKHDIVISDCPTFLAYIYAILLNKDKFNEKTAMRLSKIHKQSLLDATSYDNIIFMNLKEYVENGVRYHDQNSALEIEKLINIFLNGHNIPHIRATYDDENMILKDVLYLNE